MKNFVGLLRSCISTIYNNICILSKTTAFSLIRTAFISTGIVSIVILFYYTVFDSLNRYEKNYMTTVFEPNLEFLESKKLRIMQIDHDMQMIRESANEDFIVKTLNEHINRIIANVDMKDMRSGPTK